MKETRPELPIAERASKRPWRPFGDEPPAPSSSGTSSNSPTPRRRGTLWWRWLPAVAGLLVGGGLLLADSLSPEPPHAPPAQAQGLRGLAGGDGGVVPMVQSPPERSVDDAIAVARERSSTPVARERDKPSVVASTARPPLARRAVRYRRRPTVPDPIAGPRRVHDYKANPYTDEPASVLPWRMNRVGDTKANPFQ